MASAARTRARCNGFAIQPSMRSRSLLVVRGVLFLLGHDGVEPGPVLHLHRHVEENASRG